ncbi:MAG TPA: hypothetical protein VHD83_01995 [Puia sp.]|nr:hypothetical protein [Puia sp.]
MPVRKILYLSLQWKSLQFLTSFIVNIIFVRAFHAVAAGEFYALVYLLSLIISLFTFGLDISLNYYLSRREMNGGAARRIIMTVTFSAILISLPVLSFFLPARYAHWDIRLLLFFSGLHILGGLLTSLAGTLFTAGGKNHVPARIGFIANILLAALALFCSRRYTGQTLINMLFGLYFIFSFAQGILLFFLSYRLPFTVRTPAPPGIITVIRWSFWAFLTNFIFFVAARLYIYILPYYLSPYSQGNYIQAYKIVEYMGLVLSFTYYPFITLVAEGGEKMRDHLLLLVRMSNTIVLAFSIVMLLIGGWLFPFLFGPTFDDMYGIFVCFIPGIFAGCSSGFLTAWYFGHGQIRYNLISACIQILSMSVFFFLFTGLAGAKGAALAFSLSGSLSLVYDLWILRKQSSYAIRDILWARVSDWKTIGSKVRFKISSS